MAALARLLLALFWSAICVSAASLPPRQHPTNLTLGVETRLFTRDVVPSDEQASPARPTTSGLAAGEQDALTVRHYSLVVTEQTIWATCSPATSSLVYNGTFPGPTLRARAGEILQVRVHNHSSRNTTVHFHGLAMRLHPVMDGTHMISQWPITPGHYFDYRIPLTAEDAGTYFYHSHVGLQAMTAYGALIVDDPPSTGTDIGTGPATSTAQFDDRVANPNSQAASRPKVHIQADYGLDKTGKSSPNAPYAYDEDRVLALGDYWGDHDQDKIAAGLEADPFVWPGSPSSLLLNGVSSVSAERGGLEKACNQTAVGLLGETCTRAPPGCQTRGFAQLNLDYDKTYRLRFIGATALMYVSAGILGSDGKTLEKLQLIEADGTYLEKLEVDHIEITSGQRYSALYRSKSRLQAQKDGANGIYWMRIESRWRTGPSMWVKIVYNDDKKENPSSQMTTASMSPPPPSSQATYLPTETFGWVTGAMAPLRGWSEEMPADSEVSRTVVIDMQQTPFYGSKKGVRWMQNGASFNEQDPASATSGASGDGVSRYRPYLVNMMVGSVEVPSTYERAFSPQNRWNQDPFQSGLLRLPSSSPRGTTNGAKKTELEMAKKHHLGQGFDDKLGVYVGKPGEVLDIVLVNRPSAISSSTEMHPWHMHSRKHWTRTIQPGSFSFAALDRLYSSPSSAAFARPIPRDTTVVYASPGAAYLGQTVPNPTHEDGGWSVLRYKVDGDNAGMFVLHCHILFHLQMGMATVWAMAPDVLLDRAKPYLPAPSSNADGNGKSQTQIQGLSPAYLTYATNVDAIA
ncbi:hypothetical protein BCV70DRAFT_163380 [Testicularia cyperi]|uniref:laccase n=1 Tax=Testicularia cyperi TaxID=1882483 RepID=A0A317XMH2_9BASI|nr:hypothetical protein BCV70DRAFT_163380 [Testicularia cyperi]